MQKGIGVAGAAAAVVAFGFVSVSIRMGGGGSGWPLHDVLHPLLGLFLGPIYGPISSIVGAGLSDVITPYTALDGGSPLMGGIAALTSGLLVRRGGEWKGLWGGGIALLGGTVVLAVFDGGSDLRWILRPIPFIAALVLGALPWLRTWCRDQLASAEGTLKTAVALYVVCFVASAIGLLPFWTAGVIEGTAPAESILGPPLLLGLERVLLPLFGTLLGIALWPALQRRLFSVANQLRYGLPLFILATFFFAGRLFMERAYQATRTETVERLHEQSRAVARTLDTELERAQKLLHVPLQRGATFESGAFFRWVERIPVDRAVPSSIPIGIRPLVGRAEETARPQWEFVALPDTTAYGVGVALPLAEGGKRPQAPEEVAGVVVACIGPSILQRTLAIWDPLESHLYLVNRQHEPILESAGVSDTSKADPAAFVEALLSASDATVEAPRGRYETDVLGAIASLRTAPGYVVVEQARKDAYFHVFEMLLTMALIVLLTGGGALAVGFYVSRRVVAPLDRLIEAARRVGEGDLSTRVEVEQENELGELARTFNTMTQDLAESIHRLQSNEERLRIALDAAQMGTWNWTADLERVTWSPQTYLLLGVPHSRDDDLLEAFLARVHPDDRERVSERIQAVLQDETGFTIEHRIRPHRGDDRWVRVQGRVFHRHGAPQRMSGIIMDITARKEAEHELMAAKEKAEEMSRLKSAFLANVSHEIRTPLTSIIGFAEILADEVPTSQQDQAEKIVNSGRRLMKTLDSVLDLSMIEAGEFTLDCRPFELGREVRQRVDLMRPMAERKGLAINVDVPASDVEVSLDSNCLDRILTNLLTNAIKFTEEGHVDVRVRAHSGHVTVHVSDSGIGIDEDFLPELFEAFKQESAGLSREHGGTGLGLSITKELVELMEGTIDVESEKGEGTTFTVRFPYRVSGEEQTEVPLRSRWTYRGTE